MKAYHVKIEIKGSQPLVWRRVLIAASMDFQDLHWVIQKILNFWDSHVYMFYLPSHRLKVTHDEEAYEVYQEYLENQEQIEKTLGALDTPFARRQLENLRTAVHKPIGLKIETYLQPGGIVEYRYDSGDSWEINLTVEGILEDHVLHHPVLLGGEQAAPPEGVGEQQDFADYDSEEVQKRLKAWRE